MLFIEGQLPRGVFVLCTGRAKLSTSSAGGRTVITTIAEAGDVLGLNATISNRPYEVTAEMIEPGQANFITRDALLHFLREHGEVALRVAEQLSRDYYTVYEGVRTLGLTNSPSERLAKLLLGWSNTPHNGDPLQVKLTLTHEEIAEMIGTTRETVSRLPAARSPHEPDPDPQCRTQAPDNHQEGPPPSLRLRDEPRPHGDQQYAPRGRCAPARSIARSPTAFEANGRPALYADIRSVVETARRRSIRAIDAIRLTLEGRPMPCVA